MHRIHDAQGSTNTLVSLFRIIASGVMEIVMDLSKAAWQSTLVALHRPSGALDDLALEKSCVTVDIGATSSSR
jgi:hypothetical protein